MPNYNNEYNGVKYQMVNAGKYFIRWPSGLVSTIDAADETELKQKIDEVKNATKNGD